MKTEAEIAARIKELHERLKEGEVRHKAYAKKTGANRSTLGITDRRKREGQIEALEWVLGSEAKIYRPIARKLI